MGNCPSGELSSGELSSGELSEWGIVLDPYNLPPILKLVSTPDCVVVVCFALAARADIMTSIVFHAELLYNRRLVSETSQRVLKPMKGLFD